MNRMNGMRTHLRRHMNVNASIGRRMSASESISTGVFLRTFVMWYIHTQSNWFSDMQRHKRYKSEAKHSTANAYNSLQCAEHFYQLKHMDTTCRKAFVRDVHKARDRE